MLRNRDKLVIGKRTNHAQIWIKTTGNIHKTSTLLAKNCKFNFREYFRERPRGEFLTRGAALASQQVQPGQPPEFGSLTVTPSRGSLGSHIDAAGTVYSVSQRNIMTSSVTSGGGIQVLPEQQHEQLEREPRRYVASHDLVRTRSALQPKESRRNPTILRKSKRLHYLIESCDGQLFFSQFRA